MPALPYYGYDDIAVTFSSAVDIEAFMEHVKPVFTDGLTELNIELRSIGSGQISVNYESEMVAKFQGQGDNLNYTYSNVGGSHVYLEAINWED